MVLQTLWPYRAVAAENKRRRDVDRPIPVDQYFQMQLDRYAALSYWRGVDSLINRDNE